MADPHARSIAAPTPSCAAVQPLWQLSLDDAMRRRWAQGREQYGETWQGRHPLIEAHEELVDCLLYLGVAQAPYAERLAVQAIAERVARSIRALRPAEVQSWPGRNGSPAFEKGG